jgi:hypothetical protein
MKISGLTPNSYLPKDIKSDKSDNKAKSSKIEDKLEISSEAKLKNESIKNEAVIRERIDSKFYDSEEVINQVANSILKEIYSK